jgi:glycerol uptake operon antiterminator
MQRIGQFLSKRRLIAATEFEGLPEAMASKAEAVLLMETTIQELLSPEYRAACSRKPILVHFDFLHGLSTDRHALQFLKENVDPAGIVSTKGLIIRAANKEGIATIQRVFLIDGKSLHKTIENAGENSPDAVEIMPGIAPSIVLFFRKHISQPIILGGLVSAPEQIDAAFEAGADAISLGKRSLWNYRSSFL